MGTATARGCAKIALEQRCERDTPWDRACVAIAAAIEKKYGVEDAK
jgi:hypothetical protein